MPRGSAGTDYRNGEFFLEESHAGIADTADIDGVKALLGKLAAERRNFGNSQSFALIVVDSVKLIGNAA